MFSGKIPVWMVQDPGGLGRADERPEQRGADPASAGIWVDVERVLGHSPVGAAIRHGGGGRPAGHLPGGVGCDVAVQS